MAAEAQACAMLERLYLYLKMVNHVHLPGGEILYASEVRRVLDGAKAIPQQRPLFKLCPTCQMPTMNCDCMPEASA